MYEGGDACNHNKFPSISLLYLPQLNKRSKNASEVTECRVSSLWTPETFPRVPHRSIVHIVLKKENQCCSIIVCDLKPHILYLDVRVDLWAVEEAVDKIFHLVRHQHLIICESFHVHGSLHTPVVVIITVVREWSWVVLIIKRRVSGMHLSGFEMDVLTTWINFAAPTYCLCHQTEHFRQNGNQTDPGVAIDLVAFAREGRLRGRWCLKRGFPRFLWSCCEYILQKEKGESFMVVYTMQNDQILL